MLLVVVGLANFLYLLFICTSKCDDDVFRRIHSPILPPLHSRPSIPRYNPSSLELPPLLQIGKALRLIEHLLPPLPLGLLPLGVCEPRPRLLEHLNLILVHVNWVWPSRLGFGVGVNVSSPELFGLCKCCCWVSVVLVCGVGVGVGILTSSKPSSSPPSASTPSLAASSSCSYFSWHCAAVRPTIGAIVRHWAGISLARWSNFSSSSRDQSTFFMDGSNHSNQRALHCLADLRFRSDATRAHCCLPYFITAAFSISSSEFFHTPPLMKIRTITLLCFVCLGL